jgi:hypothetical protein
MFFFSKKKGWEERGGNCKIIQHWYQRGSDIFEKRGEGPERGRKIKVYDS